MTIMTSENWESLVKMQNTMLLKEVRKLYRSLKREHCDDCSPNYECQTCKPEFDKIRDYIKRLKELTSKLPKEIAK